MPSLLIKLLLVCPGLLLLAASGMLVLRPDPRAAERRAAEQMWQARRITEARQQFLALHVTMPHSTADVHLALIELMRGDCPAAQRFAADALAGSRRRDEAALMHLVIGQCAALRNDQPRSDAEWASVDPRSPYHALTFVLRGEYALRGGAIDQAVGAYQTALASKLLEPWPGLARARLALVLAQSSPEHARQLLAAVPATLPAADVYVQPFLPIAPDAIVEHARQIEAILQQDSGEWAQLLGQQALGLGLPRFAIMEFEQVPLTGRDGVRAQAHAAFARWQLGQTDAARTQLAELVAAAPDESIVATLYATAALEANDLAAASGALDAAEQRDPLDPAIALVRSNLLAAQHHYPGAIDELRRARDIAQPPVRGRYAIALARQHLDLIYRICDAGIAAAREATVIAPDDAAAWQVLAESLYHCRAHSAAADAARSGLEHAPADAALRWWLGAALWEQGQHAAARPQLIAAADLAPADEWRQRAELLLWHAD